MTNDTLIIKLKKKERWKASLFTVTEGRDLLELKRKFRNQRPTNPQFLDIE